MRAQTVGTMRGGYLRFPHAAFGAPGEAWTRPATLGAVATAAATEFEALTPTHRPGIVAQRSVALEPDSIPGRGGEGNTVRTRTPQVRRSGSTLGSGGALG